MRESASDIRRYLQAHDTVRLSAVLIVLAMCNAAFGWIHIALPSAQAPGGMVSVPFRKEVPVIFASLAVGSLSSHMDSFERSASAALGRARWIHPGAAILAVTLLVAVSELLASSPGQAAVFIRAVLLWAGMALVSGSLLEWKLAWVLPVASIFPVVYYGRGPSGEVRWWDWTSLPASDPVCWGLAALSLGVGFGLIAASPWRLRRAKRAARLLGLRP
ncbi:hypothetical protein [Streptomyces sp. NBC_01214]|uniref:hypothetical protein n=1 Tax=Streptomyces sp. NBC_01214 TaxID=2903777 RepID=UPI00225338C9|nr:hypothetical protein [Streptomyces sp. NBC_01214]